KDADFTTRVLRESDPRWITAGRGAQPRGQICVGAEPRTGCAAYRLAHRQPVSLRAGTSRPLEARTLLSPAGVQEPSRMATQSESHSLRSPLLRAGACLSRGAIGATHRQRRLRRGVPDVSDGSRAARARVRAGAEECSP